MKTLAEKIAVMQAAERGEKIEARGKLDEWSDVSGSQLWNWQDYDYRIAPKKPREWAVYVLDDKIVGIPNDHYGILAPMTRQVRVREVVDGPTPNTNYRFVRTGSDGRLYGADYLSGPWHDTGTGDRLISRMTQFGREWSRDGGTTWSALLPGGYRFFDGNEPI